MPFFGLGQRLSAQPSITCFHLPNVANRETRALKCFCLVAVSNVLYPENTCNSLIEGFLGMYFLEDKITSRPIPLQRAFVGWVSL